MKTDSNVLLSDMHTNKWICWFLPFSWPLISFTFHYVIVTLKSPCNTLSQTYTPRFLVLLKMLQQAECSLSSKIRNQIKLGHNSSFLGETKDDEYNRNIYYRWNFLGLDAKSSVSGYKLPGKCPVLPRCLLWTATSSLLKSVSTDCNSKHFFTSYIQKYPHRTLQTKYKSIKYFPLKQHRTTTWKWTYAYMHVYGHTHKQTQACTHVQSIKPWEYSKTISHYQRHIHYHQVCHPRNACRAAVTGWVPPSPPHQHLWQQGSEKGLEEACSPIQNR